MEFRNPIIHRVTNHGPNHVLISVHGIATTGDVVAFTYVVVLRNATKYSLIHSMVVYYVHDYTNTLFMEFVNHFFYFFNLLGVVISTKYRSVSVFWYVVVPWVITPVVARAVLRINVRAGCIIEDRLELNVSYPKFLQVVNTGLNAGIGIGSTRLNHTKVTTSLFIVYARRFVDGKVTYVDFVNNSVFSVL